MQSYIFARQNLISFCSLTVIFWNTEVPQSNAGLHFPPGNLLLSLPAHPKLILFPIVCNEAPSLARFVVPRLIINLRISDKSIDKVLKALLKIL